MGLFRTSILRLSIYKEPDKDPAPVNDSVEEPIGTDPNVGT